MGEYWARKAANKSRRTLTPKMRADGLTHSMDRSYGAKRSGVYDRSFEDTTRLFERIVERHFWTYAEEHPFGQPKRKRWRDRQASLSSLDFAYVLSRMADHLPRGGSVVEIGAGFGGLARALLAYDPTMSLTLVDLESISCMQRYYLENVMCHGVRFASEIPVGPVDAVISTRMMCEIDLEEVDKYLLGIDSVLKPGGTFYCVHHDRCRNNFDQWSIPPGLVLEREGCFPFHSFETERHWRERLWRKA